MNANVNKLAVNRAQTQIRAIPPLPPIPDDVKKRFPSMLAYEAAMGEWRQQLQAFMADQLGALAKE